MHIRSFQISKGEAFNFRPLVQPTIMACLQVEKVVSPLIWRAGSFRRISQDKGRNLLLQCAGNVTTNLSQRRSHLRGGLPVRQGGNDKQRWRSRAFTQPESFDQSTRNAPMSRGVQQLSQNDPDEYPFWLWLCKSAYNTAKDAFQFLREQPGQLKFIDWPSLQSTVRMTILTVIVVALFIVFLATMDSTFSYLLSSILRRVPK